MASALVIVGGGRMGSALAEGLLRAAWCAPADLDIVESSAEQRAALSRSLPSLRVDANLDVSRVDSATGAVVAVKPGDAPAALRMIGDAGVSRVLSIVAGLATTRIEGLFTGPVAVIRAMPNTPILVGRGASAIAGGAHVTAADLEWAESILGAVGVVVRLSESSLDAVTGLSGSMPAYLYLVVEALIDAGVHQGLSRDVSRQLVVSTFAGSAAMLASGESPEELRAQVTSPGGTTAAGLRMLEARAVRSAFLEAVAAAAERSRQLGR